MENNLQLVGYRINKFDFKFHDKYKQTTQFKILPKIECRAGRNEKTLFVNLSVRINEDISSPVPFNIDVEMFGTFNILKEIDQNELAKEAMECLYPFLRASVASITANCNIPGYVLPMLQAQNAPSPNTNPNVN